MIAFNNSEHSSEDKILQNLEKLFNELSSLNSNLSEHNNISPSDIKNILEDVLYKQNKTELSLLISKNTDNTLNILLDILDE